MRAGGIRTSSIRTGFLVSGLAGLIFGTAFYLFMLATKAPGTSTNPGFLLIPVACGLIAGAAGAGGAYLDALLEKRGMASPGKRRLVSFLVVTLSTLVLFLSVAIRLELVEIQRQVIWGTLLGLGFGVSFSIAEYYLWRIRQKVLALEVENRYLSEMAEKDAALAKATSDLVLAEERNRVARDLHDSVSSGIHGIVYALHTLRRAVSEPDRPGSNSREQISGIIDLIDKTAHSTQDELRAMILELKPALLDEKGLSEALRLHCELFAQRRNVDVDLSIDFEADTSPTLSPDQQVAIYRIVQESLANVERHSKAGHVTVSLATEAGAFVLNITDNGSGFDPAAATSGLGLHSMEQRALRNNGKLKVVSRPGGGTTVEAVFGAVQPADIIHK